MPRPSTTSSTPQRPMSSLTSLLALLPFLLVALSALSGVKAQKAEVECPDSSLTSYLLSLLDSLYANGLTHFETLLAKASESDQGYDVLESWYADSEITLFVPTDAAFQSAGLVPPFDTLSDKAVADMVALHTVSGKWEYEALPQSPAKGFADSHLSAKAYMNASAESTAMVPLVMQRGDQGAINVRLPSGNATTWGWVIQGQGEIWNIVIIPVDTVLPFPPKLSEALTIPTTSRSTKGLPEFQRALDQAGGAQQLEGLTQGGFTIFAPIDEAFTPEIARALASEAAIPILGNHYATNYSLFSRIWVDNGVYEMPVVSGETLLVQQGEIGATVTLGTQTVRMLRSDIVLENGVMHIIEDVLADATLVATASPSVTASASRTAAPSQSQGSSTVEESVVENASSGGTLVTSVTSGMLPRVLAILLTTLL